MIALFRRAPTPDDLSRRRDEVCRHNLAVYAQIRALLQEIHPRGVKHIDRVRGLYVAISGLETATRKQMRPASPGHSPIPSTPERGAQRDGISENERAVENRGRETPAPNRAQGE